MAVYKNSFVSNLKKEYNRHYLSCISLSIIVREIKHVIVARVEFVFFDTQEMKCKVYGESNATNECVLESILTSNTCFLNNVYLQRMICSVKGLVINVHKNISEK